jgi:CelD/BcsL family acetyltransferase involved in cellulose biosynthesis
VVAPTLLSSGLLRLYRMRIKDRTIAVNYSFFHRQSVYCYLQGFDPEFSGLSPGMQLMFAVIEEAVRFGARRFDFLRGEEGYKLHWRPEAEPTYRVEIPRRLALRKLRVPA